MMLYETCLYRCIFVWLLVAVPSITSADAQARSEDIYAPYAELLDRYLVERVTEVGGLVSAFRYRAALDDPDTARLIDRQRVRLAELQPEFTDKDTAIAFWVNAYNFFMLAHILENPEPGGGWLEGIKDYGSLFNPYRIFQRKLFNVGGRLYSLDDIEKGILLGEEYREKGWKEARVHFAVNCASVGCPPLRKDIYRAGTVDTMLTENTRRALLTRRHFYIEGDTLYLTRLFDWYREDFIEEAGSVRGFVNRYLGRELRAEVRMTTDLEYIDYDWALNEPANFPELR